MKNKGILLFPFLLLLLFAGVCTSAGALENTDTTTVNDNSITVTGSSDSLSVVINKDISTETLSKQYLSSISLLEKETSSALPGMSGVMGIRTDPETGESLYQLEPNLPELPNPVSEGTSEEPAISLQASYSVGATKTIQTVQTVQGSSKVVSHSMKCLYVGSHCTVWASSQDNSSIRINSTNAANIGQSFDSNFSTMTNAFGSYWYDADGDGKVSILCYDIDSDYNKTSISEYTGGYFWPCDLVQSNGYINKANYGTARYYNGLDCIHIDTYPGMVKYLNSTCLDNVASSYSTLFHEFQHLLNFSHSVEGNYVEEMDTYLNEAFSMAAEHLVLGSDSVADRITYFNSASYQSGFPLTYWTGNLSNYSNSYLFGQYLRTRYGQETGSNGNALFSVVQGRRTSSNSDTLTVIADILNTSKLQLIKDFWVAVALKEDSGYYGFNGEEWADAIDISSHVKSSSTSSDYIYNGGARYYSNISQYDNTERGNLVVLPVRSNVPVTGVSLNKTATTLTVGNTETLTATVTPSNATNKAVTWKSSNTSVATVSSSGLVTAKAAGTATITVTTTDGAKTAACTVTVREETGIITSGTCGENLSWTLNTNGVLTITGSGAMSGKAIFSSLEKTREQVTTAVLPDGITNIGTNAFNGCSNLKSINIPTSVKSIEWGAFYNCSKLTDVVVPASVTEIGSYAFYGCGELGSVILPNGVTEISFYAFYDCDGLTDITIPSSVTAIGEEAFEGCSSLTAIYVEEENPNYSSLNGVLFDKNQKTLIVYPIGKSESKYTIPNSTIIIESAAFSQGINLTDVTIPNSVTSIGEFAFSGCGLCCVTLPDHLVQIAMSTFIDCTNLTEVTIPESVVRIGENAFDECNNLSDVYYTGTQNQWDAISIGEYNEALSNAAIHYTSDPSTFQITEVETLATSYRITGTTPTHANTTCVVCAAYDTNGRQLSVSMQTLTAGSSDFTFTLPNTGKENTVKVFLLDSVTKQPLANAISKTL